MMIKTLLAAFLVSAAGALVSLLGEAALGCYLCFVMVCCTRYIAAKIEQNHRNINPNNSQEDNKNDI